MGLFYAYLMDRTNLVRQLITFVNRDTADEWWRAISNPPSPYVGHIKRISTQFYVQTGLDASRFSSNPEFPDRIHFCENMFFTHITNTSSYKRTLENPAPIPATEISDHISDRWYFIQSKVDSFSHWYLRTNGACAVCGDIHCDAIHVSSESRTRFHVRVRSDGEVPENFVMIGKDEISIAAPKGYILHISDAGDLKATKGYQGETDLLFSDLKKRFVARTERLVNGEVWEYVESVERGAGEVWELVE